MKKLFALLVFKALLVLGLYAQYSVSETTITFYDAERDRDIPCKIYYPSVIDTNPGENKFPYIIFGHGFAMSIGVYGFFGEGITPHGVIVILPDTETGVPPHHENFAKDFAFLSNNFYQQSLSPDGHFHNSVAQEHFIMGHSLGGGASHLASSFDVNPNAIISFAAAETTPSAAEVANVFTGKVIMFVGENDLVTPYDEHQEPIFNNSAGNCKTEIVINGGVHCYFNDYSLTCAFGETSVGSDAQISREEQQQVVLDFIGLLVQSELYHDNNAYNQYLDSLDNSNRVSATRICTPVNIENIIKGGKLNIYPNPASNYLSIEYSGLESVSYFTIFNIAGEIVKKLNIKGSEGIIDLELSDFSPGQYIISCQNSEHIEKIIVK